MGPTFEGVKSAMFLELRQYRAKPGQRDTWVRYFHQEVKPFQTSKGMKISGPWIGEQEDDLFIWMREFADEAEFERLSEAVYQSDEWKNRIAPPIREMLDRDRMVITRLTPASA
jgi:hypothetical protein